MTLISTHQREVPLDVRTWMLRFAVWLISCHSIDCKSVQRNSVLSLFFKASCTTPESVNIYVYLYMCTGAENGHSKLSSVGGKPRTASRTAGTKRLVLSGHWAPVWWRLSASRWLDSLTNTHPWLKCSLMPQMHRDDHSCTRALNPPPPPPPPPSLSHGKPHPD